MTDNKTALLIAASNAANLASDRAEDLKNKLTEIDSTILQCFYGPNREEDLKIAKTLIHLTHELADENAVETSNHADVLKDLMEKVLDGIEEDVPKQFQIDSMLGRVS